MRTHKGPKENLSLPPELIYIARVCHTSLQRAEDLSVTNSQFSTDSHRHAKKQGNKEQNKSPDFVPEETHIIRLMDKDLKMSFKYAPRDKNNGQRTKGITKTIYEQNKNINKKIKLIKGIKQKL